MVNADKSKECIPRHLLQPRHAVTSLLTVFAVMLSGCVGRASTWKGKVEWPDEHSATLVAPSMEAGAALAAAGAIREMVKQRLATDPGLFWGCASPEQGLDVAVFTGPTLGLYYVVLHQRFDRCGGPSGRVLGEWDAYAVTPQGEVVGQAPLSSGEASADVPASPEQTPPPEAEPSPSDAADSPAPTPPSAQPPSPVP